MMRPSRREPRLLDGVQWYRTAGHLREIANALLYVARSGCQGRALPHDFPPWEAAYWYFRTWKKGGTLDRLMVELRGGLRQAEGRQRQPRASVIDTHSVKRTGKGSHGIDAHKKVN